MSKIEVSIADSGRIKTFISKLADNFEELPKSLQLELLDILNCEQFEYSAEWFNSKFPNSEFKAYADGELLSVKVTSMNLHLKLVKYHVLSDQKEPLIKDGDFVIGELKANSFRAYADNKLIMRW